MARDTQPDALRAQIEALRRMSGAERVTAASDLTVLAHELALARLHQRVPRSTPDQIVAEHYRTVLGPDLASRVLEARDRRGRSPSGAR